MAKRRPIQQQARSSVQTVSLPHLITWLTIIGAAITLYQTISGAVAPLVLNVHDLMVWKQDMEDWKKQSDTERANTNASIGAIKSTLDVTADKVAHIDDYYRRAERHGVQ